jgi:hypothetical protein
LRRAARIDRTQPEIVQALRARGYSVAITSQCGHGFPDLVVGKMRSNGQRFNWMLECKDWQLPPSARELTPDQCIFHANWAGQVDVVNSVEEALLLVEGD